MRKILMTTFGSYGDLHPYIGMACVLRKHGDEVTIATHAHYREVVERSGARFVAIKPGLDEIGPQESWSNRANHPVFGTQFIVQKIILPYLEDSYQTIKAAAAGHDFIISHVLCFATPVVAEELGIPWVSTVLQPAAFFSAHDPPALGFLKFLPRLKFLGPSVMQWLLRQLARPTRSWLRPIDALRARVGLPYDARNVLIDGFSPFGTLALFSSAFSASQPDWPETTMQVGFPLFDEETTGELSPELTRFLDAGPAPVVFTLGTAIVMMQTPYFEIAYRAITSLGLRAVFLVGKTPNRIPEAARTDPRILISTYEPFSQLFPRAAAIVHQCGVGTTAQALASGRPQILVPFAHDQPDNARRVVALGCGLSIPARRLSVSRMVQRLNEVLNTPAFADRAREVQRDMQVGSFEPRLLEAIAKVGSTS